MNGRVEGTNACETHQPQWQNFKKFNSRQVASGVRRMLQRPSENNAWQPRRGGPNPQRHDDPSTDPPPVKNSSVLADIIVLRRYVLLVEW